MQSAGYRITAEHIRIEEAREQQVAWKKRGPYLNERHGEPYEDR